MLPRLVPEISPLYAFCDVVGVGVVGVGIGDSRSWINTSMFALMQYEQYVVCTPLCVYTSMFAFSPESGPLMNRVSAL